MQGRRRVENPALIRRVSSVLALLSLLYVVGIARAQNTPESSGTDSLATTRPSSDFRPVRHEKFREPEGAALRSLVLPGWGQHYNGEPTKGWILGSVAVLGVLLGTETISSGILSAGHEKHNLERSLGWVLYGGSVAWATVDAYRRARALNRENGYDLAVAPASPPPLHLTLLRFRF